MSTPKYVNDFLDWLMSFVNYEAVLNKYTNEDHIFSLDPIRNLCDKLGSPEKATPAIHVAGSKGKGSVCKMSASILDLIYQDKPVMVYSSPHVYDFRERMSTANGFFDDKVYQQSINDLKETVAREGIKNVTWYEFVTAFGFLCARNSQSAYAVVETGIGGRLDATNIIRPQLSVITPIELEHTALLGDTVEKIAVEKAGIIKPETPVVISPQTFPSVNQVFEKTAKKLNSPIYFTEQLVKIFRPTYKNNQMQVQLTSDCFKRPLNLNMQLIGTKQAENAATAALAIKVLFPDLDESIIETGLSSAKLPGRFEILDNLIFDGAHTPVSIQQTLDTVKQLYPNQKLNLLFACVAGKDVEHIAPLFRNKFEQVFLTIPGKFKESDLSATEAAFSKNQIRYISDGNYQELIKQALASTPSNTKLLITGSFYLLDEVEKVLSDR